MAFNLSKLLIGLSFAVAVAATGQAAPGKLSPQARIPFARTITDFRTVGRETVYIRANGRKWYRADLLGSCFDLPFAQTIGFEHRGTPSIDRFSTLLVGRQRCPLTSLTEVSGPPPKSREPAKRRGR